MSKIRDFFRRVADWTDGKRTHIANILGFGFTFWLWFKGTLTAPEALGAAALTGFSSLFRLLANEPGPLSRAATLPEATELKVAVRESQAVSVQP